MKKYDRLKWANRQVVKETIRQDTWCSAHINCFRCSLKTENTQKGNKRLPESEAHIRTKFNRYLHWRTKGFDVLVEARLKTGDRPDLLCWNEYEIFIEEILESETDKQFKAKVKKYPFHCTGYRVEK